METNVNYSLVGLFVISLTAAIALVIIWLSAGFSIVGEKTYLVYMQESVSGLSQDSPVEYNGVNVGSVKTISINKKNPHLVELLLNIKGDAPITNGTVATLNSRGLTGIAYVALKDTGDLTPLTILPGQEYPIIKSGPSLFTRLDTALQKLNDSLYRVSSSIQALLDEDNLRYFKGILSNMNEITHNLAGDSARINTIIENTSRASAKMGPFLQSGHGAMQVLQTQTLPDANQVINNLNTVSHNLLDVSNQLKENPSVIIRGKQPTPPGPGEN